MGNQNGRGTPGSDRRSCRTNSSFSGSFTSSQTYMSSNDFTMTPMSSVGGSLGNSRSGSRDGIQTLDQSYHDSSSGVVSDAPPSYPPLTSFQDQEPPEEYTPDYAKISAGKSQKHRRERDRAEREAHAQHDYVEYTDQGHEYYIYDNSHHERAPQQYRLDPRVGQASNSKNHGYHEPPAYATPYATQVVYPDIHSAQYGDIYDADLEDTERMIRSGVKKKRSRHSQFDRLPDDVIVKIFANLSSDELSRCSLVNRRWYNLAWEPSLWKTIKLSNVELPIDKALRSLTKRLSYDTPTVCVMVEKIVLNGCDKLTDKGLHYIAKRCVELRHLELQGCTTISNRAIFEVVSRCVNLEYLNLQGCSSITCISLTPEAAMQTTQNGRQIFLRHLDMTDCYDLEDAGLQIIASHCTKIQHLYLRRCVRITDLGIQYVASYCSNLREFSVSDCRKITDFGMRELSKLENNLRYLSVAKCDKVSDVGIKYIAKHCKKLRYLNVRGCEAVSDDSLDLLAQNCTRLKSLDVGKCDITDEGLHILANFCSHLRKLSLKSCDAITNDGILAIAKTCKGLQQLNIQDCHVTVDAYKAVKKHCKKCIIEHTNPGFY
ncbi:unnamed protein product [Owenia fusiformis]|uniref:Uncharacterized protein n=1 Tax=Owenia fusiformis TaxID=6347 RepID=A0A8J1UXC0_OWEFU|nr:unnamed protein product [Owenia fusiformis]